MNGAFCYEAVENMVWMVFSTFVSFRGAPRFNAWFFYFHEFSPPPFNTSLKLGVPQDFICTLRVKELGIYNIFEVSLHDGQRLTVSFCSQFLMVVHKEDIIEKVQVCMQSVATQ
jgi:hypothetical protein